MHTQRRPRERLASVDKSNIYSNHTSGYWCPDADAGNTEALRQHPAWFKGYEIDDLDEFAPQTDGVQNYRLNYRDRQGHLWCVIERHETYAEAVEKVYITARDAGCQQLAQIKEANNVLVPSICIVGINRRHGSNMRNELTEPRRVGTAE